MNRGRAVLLAFIDALIVLLLVSIVLMVVRLLGEITGAWSVDFGG